MGSPGEGPRQRRPSLALRVSIFSHIDLYCERTTQGLFGEPLNLLSNAAFFYASIRAYRMAAGMTAEKHAFHLKAMALGIAVVGLGSSLFHAFATRWAEWADMVPISLLMVYFLLFFSRSVLGLGRHTTLFNFALFFGSTLGFLRFLNHPRLHGSQAYFGFLAMVFILGAWSHYKKSPAAAYLVSAACVFCISLFFRSLDLSACALWPIGTHFLWHVLNGVMILLLFQSLVKAL